MYCQGYLRKNLSITGSSKRMFASVLVLTRPRVYCTTRVHYLRNCERTVMNVLNSCMDTGAGNEQWELSGCWEPRRMPILLHRIFLTGWKTAKIYSIFNWMDNIISIMDNIVIFSWNTYRYATILAFNISKIKFMLFLWISEWDRAKNIFNE